MAFTFLFLKSASIICSNSYFLKKYGTFSNFFLIKCHTLYCQEVLHTLFLKARFWFAYKLPYKIVIQRKGFLSCWQAADKAVLLLFSKEESEKNKEKPTGKSQFPVHHTLSFKILWQKSKLFQVSQNQVIKQKFGLILRTSPVECQIQDEECHSEVSDPTQGNNLSTLNWAFLLEALGKTHFLDDNSALLCSRPLNPRAQLKKSPEPFRCWIPTHHQEFQAGPAEVSEQLTLSTLHSHFKSKLPFPSLA